MSICGFVCFTICCFAWCMATKISEIGDTVSSCCSDIDKIRSDALATYVWHHSSPITWKKKADPPPSQCKWARFRTNAKMTDLPAPTTYKMIIMINSAGICSRKWLCVSALRITETPCSRMLKNKFFFENVHNPETIRLRWASQQPRCREPQNVSFLNL